MCYDEYQKVKFCILEILQLKLSPRNTDEFYVVLIQAKAEEVPHHKRMINYSKLSENTALARIVLKPCSTFFAVL